MTSPADPGADGPAAGDDFLFLRERVDDEEIASLFTEDPAALERAVRHLIDRARDDSRMEAALIDTLEIAVDEECDETLASSWIAVILGEAGSARAIEPLSRCLAREEDETLRDAARIALLRIGIPAIRFLIDEVEDGRSPEFHQGVYEVLGESGIIDDAPTIERISEFLIERFPIEIRVDSNERTVEALAMAAARLGVRELLEPIKELLASRYGMRYPMLEDAMGLLEENEEGRPIVPTIPPWEERYGWLFDEETDRARVRRPSVPLPEGYRYPFEGVDVTAGGKLTDSRGYLFEVPGADQALEGFDDPDEEDDDES